MGKLIFVGGTRTKKWLQNGKSYSRNFHQQDRIYDELGISNAVTMDGVKGYVLVREKEGDSQNGYK